MNPSFSEEIFAIDIYSLSYVIPGQHVTLLYEQNKSTASRDGPNVIQFYA